MVDLEMGMRSWRQTVFDHDGVVAFARPMAQLPRAGRADRFDVGRPHRAGCDRGIRDDRLGACDGSPGGEGGGEEESHEPRCSRSQLLRA